MILHIVMDYNTTTKSKLEFSRIRTSLSEPHLVNLTYKKYVGIPWWPILGVVEASVCGLEGGGDNGG